MLYNFNLLTKQNSMKVSFFSIAMLAAISQAVLLESNSHTGTELNADTAVMSNLKSMLD